MKSFNSILIESISKMYSFDQFLRISNLPLLTSVCFPSSPDICSVNLTSIFRCWILKFLSFEGGSSFVEWISFLIATLDRNSGCVRLCSFSSATVSLFNLTGTCSTALLGMHWKILVNILASRSFSTQYESYLNHDLWFRETYLGRKFLSIWRIHISQLFRVLVQSVSGSIQPPEFREHKILKM